MSIIDDKLDRGLDLLADAHDDTDLLGVALLAFQGALADYLRELLGTNASLMDEEQAFVSDPEASVAGLVELAQRSGDLTREQSWRILDTEKLCRSFAAGAEFRGSPREVRGYGRFVSELSGRSEISRELIQLVPGAAAQQKGAPVAIHSATESILRWLPGLTLLALLLAGGWWLFNRASSPDEQAAAPTSAARSDGAAVPTLGPQLSDGTLATAAPSLTTATLAAPTPELPPGARSARIVRLGSGPGWLHDTPSFASPTLPIRLSEGQEVLALGPEQSDADGVPWVYVSVGGYEGWSPLNNIEYISP